MPTRTSSGRAVERVEEIVGIGQRTAVDAHEQIALTDAGSGGGGVVLDDAHQQTVALVEADRAAQRRVRRAAGASPTPSRRRVLV